MSPSPVAAAAAPAPAAIAKPTAAPTAALAPAPAVAAGAPAAAPAAAGPADAAAKEVVGLLQNAKALDALWTAGAVQAQSAVAALGKDGKLSGDAEGALTRISFIGKVLGEQIPADAKPVALPKGVSPAEAIGKAEQSFTTAVAALAQQSMQVGSSLPKDAPKELVAGYMAAHERITDALYAVKFAMRIAPPPAAAQAAQGAAAQGAPAKPAAPQGAPVAAKPAAAPTNPGIAAAVAAAKKK